MTRRPQKSADGHGSADAVQRSAAVDALLACLGDGAAAKAAGVSTRTVRRWRTEDAAFIAELDEGLAAMRKANADDREALLRKAMGVLGQALDDGDVQAALGVFRTLTPAKLDATVTTLSAETRARLEAAIAARARGA